MIKANVTSETLNMLTNIEKNRFTVNSIELSETLFNRLRKNSKKMSSYASTKIEGNPLSKEQVSEAIDSDPHRHFLKPEQEVRNYFLALEYLEKCQKNSVKFSKELILKVQSYVEKGASADKIGIRGPMPPGMLFAVYDSETGNADYIPPEYIDIPQLLDELVSYVNETNDHPLIVAAIVHYQLVTIHPFEDGNGRTARLLSGYIMDINGYGFGGIGSLEEYFAYDSNEYYKSLQMGLPALYYLGRDNPPHSEIWINYFIRMVELNSSRVKDITTKSSDEDIINAISYLKIRDLDFLVFLLKMNIRIFTPKEVSTMYGTSNRTIINRCAELSKHGFLMPNVVKQRITNYELSDFTLKNKEEIINIAQERIIK